MIAPFQPMKRCRPPKSLDQLAAGAQEQVEGVAEDERRSRAPATSSAPRPRTLPLRRERHERRRADLAVRGLEHPGARAGRRVAGDNAQRGHRGIVERRMARDVLASILSVAQNLGYPAARGCSWGSRRSASRVPGRDRGDLRRPRREHASPLDRARDRRRLGRRDHRRQHRLRDRPPRRPRAARAARAASTRSASGCWRSATPSSSATGPRPCSSGAGSPGCGSGPPGSPGASEMRWPTFIIWNALGGIAWATSVALAAYYGGTSVENVFSQIGLYGGITAGVADRARARAVWWRRRVKRAAADRRRAASAAQQRAPGHRRRFGDAEQLEAVGATSARIPSRAQPHAPGRSRSAGPARASGRLRAAVGLSISSLLPWSAVTMRRRRRVDGGDDLAEARSTISTALDRGRDHAGVADHVGVGEVDDREARRVLAPGGDERVRDPRGAHLRLVVIGRHLAARGRARGARRAAAPPRRR